MKTIWQSLEQTKNEYHNKAKRKKTTIQWNSLQYHARILFSYSFFFIQFTHSLAYIWQIYFFLEIFYNFNVFQSHFIKFVHISLEFNTVFVFILNLCFSITHFQLCTFTRTVSTSWLTIVWKRKTKHLSNLEMWRNLHRFHLTTNSPIIHSTKQ